MISLLRLRLLPRRLRSHALSQLSRLLPHIPIVRRQTQHQPVAHPPREKFAFRTSSSTSSRSHALLISRRLVSQLGATSEVETDQQTIGSSLGNTLSP
jgi:hypothetical protein